ncbi:unnamed protein product [Clavelina lepadiformis]|uniref:BACK domain-containing protein n=1 Tax=Clavelina lepadiformis TaxID=159417 RepID=A0ABP0FA13_CLALP
MMTYINSENTPVVMGKSKKKQKSSTSSSGTVRSNSTTGPSVTLDANSNQQDSSKDVSKEKEKENDDKYDMAACLFAFSVARKLNQPKYHAKTQKYIIKNFDDAVREPKFYDEVTKDDIVVFLQSDDLVVSCEEVIYHMVIRWVKHRQDERLQYLEELLELVRFPQLELDFLGQQVVREPIVLDTGVGQLLLHEAFEYHQNKIAKERGYKKIALM